MQNTKKTTKASYTFAFLPFALAARPLENIRKRHNETRDSDQFNKSEHQNSIPLQKITQAFPKDEIIKSDTFAGYNKSNQQ